MKSKHFTSSAAIWLVCLALLTPCAFAANDSAQAASRTKNTSATISQSPDADWDEAVGLWITKKRGHTRLVDKLETNHSAVTAANRLLDAARNGKMENIPVQRVLGVLRDMQCLKRGDRYGCFRWYWEEKEIEDTNAAFFIGMPLILLDRVYLDKLPSASRAQLKTILKDLKVWFDHEAERLATHYPNKYLGDLVCDWLLHESLGNPAGDEKLRKIMGQAAADWREKHWGWGEHMSDGYCRVLLDELSMLLLLSKKLPDDLRKDYQGLLDELLAIEDAFGNRPRVPTIRCYALDYMPEHVNYRDIVREADGSDPLHLASASTAGDWKSKTRFIHSTASPTLYRLGWHEKMPPRAALAKDIHIPLAGGSEAVCRAEDDMLLGAITRYPILPNTDGKNWGLAWQSMPVAFVRQDSDWGFLRFYAREGDRERGLPALERRAGYLDNGLSAIENPVPVGQTWSIQHGGDLVVLRIMPVVPASWNAYEDHLQVKKPTSGAMKEIQSGKEGILGLDFQYPERTFSVRLLPLAEGGVAKLDHLTLMKDPAIRWGVRFEGEALHQRNKIATLWGMSLNGPIENAPTLTRISGKQPYSFRVQWNWKNRDWKLRIDPSSEHPLLEE